MNEGTPLGIITGFVLIILLPFILWFLHSRKTAAGALPFIIGFVAYIYISFARGIARAFVLNGSVRHHPIIFYFLSALLSGVFEEVGRYFTFKKVIPRYSQYKDAVSYGTGHGGCEIILTSGFIANTLFDSVLGGIVSIFALGFHTAMTILVFTAVHYEFDKKHLYIAIALHTAADMLPMLYHFDLTEFFAYLFIDWLFSAAVSYYAYKIWKNKNHSAA